MILILCTSLVLAPQEPQPPLMQWQRNYDDAVAVSQATGRPLLLVMNMDQEPASETLARVRYRNPEFAQLAAPYVALVASIQRHNARDHDERGRRIVCPRFGCITCGEHVAAEAVLYEKYFKDNPVAPRHLAIGKDGAVLFDRFLDSDLGRIDEALRAHAPNAALDDIGDRAAALANAELLQSRDAAARVVLEIRFQALDAGGRAALLSRCASSSARPWDLLRLGLADGDAGVRAAAASALAACADATAVPLLTEALTRREVAQAERNQLLAALQRLGEQSSDAKSMWKLLAAVDTPSAVVDVAQWRERIARAQDGTATDASASAEIADVETRLNELDGKLKEQPDDAALRLESARWNWRFAELRLRDGKDPSFALQDCKRAAAAALKAGADRAAASAFAARAAFWLSEVVPAGEHAAEALRQETSPDLLAILAQARVAAIYDAIQKKVDWPGAWASDAHAAYTVLAEHPAGTAEQAAAHVGFLDQMRLTHAAQAAVTRALLRFPDSPALHGHLRNQVLERGGPDALEAWYEAGLESATDRPTHLWFFGYATLVVAEVHKRANQNDQALAAYDRAIEHFDQFCAARPALRDSADHFAALARAGAARIRLEQGAHEAAVMLLVEALRRRPASANDPDGLERTPAQTAGALRTALERAGMQELRNKLDDVLKELGVTPSMPRRI